jgi:hypothetical protein
MRAASIWGLAALMAMSVTAFGQEEGERPSGDDRPEREEQRQRGPRDGDRPGPREGDRPGPPGFALRMSPLMIALDTNRNGDLSAEEVAQAVAALKKLDKNEDGVIDREELRPQPPFGEGRGPRPRGERDGDADRPRPDGARPQGERDRERPDREDAERGPRGEGDTPRAEGDRPSRPDGDRGSRAEGERGFRGRGPDPERFVDRLMQSDADGDGKLSREELLKAFENMRPGPGPGRGDRERDGGRERDGDTQSGGDQPQRPE